MCNECQVRLEEYKQTRPSSCFEPNPICFKQTFIPRAKRNKQLNALCQLASFFLSIQQNTSLCLVLSGASAEGLTIWIKFPCFSWRRSLPHILTERNLVLLAKPMTSIHHFKSTLKGTKNNSKG